MEEAEEDDPMREEHGSALSTIAPDLADAGQDPSGATVGKRTPREDAVDVEEGRRPLSVPRSPSTGDVAEASATPPGAVWCPLIRPPAEEADEDVLHYSSEEEDILPEFAS